jgi:hypothetical protein
MSFVLGPPGDSGGCGAAGLILIVPSGKMSTAMCGFALDAALIARVIWIALCERCAGSSSHPGAGPWSTGWIKGGLGVWGRTCTAILP